VIRAGEDVPGPPLELWLLSESMRSRFMIMTNVQGKKPMDVGVMVRFRHC
jgi:hypothetical protein